MAYHFHWPMDMILDLEHGERLRWVQEISGINQRSNTEGQNAGNHENFFA